MSKPYGVLVVLACLAMLNPAAEGQDKGKTKAKAVRPPYRDIEKSMPPQVLSKLLEKGRALEIGTATAAGVKDLETVAAWLKDFEIASEMKDEGGAKYLLLPESWITFSFSNDGSVLWINSWIIDIKDPSTATAGNLMNLLQYSCGLAHFCIDNSGETLGCCSHTEARLATKNSIRKRIEAIITTKAAAERFYSEFK